MPARHPLCRRCLAPVAVTTTEAGRMLLIDPTPDPQYGNTAVHRDATGRLRSRRITAERPAMPWERVCVPHAATCAANQPQRPGGRADTHAEQPRPAPQARRRSATGLPAGVVSLTDYRRRRRT
ncbi:hypothetical protein [Streptomyces sp. NBRC 109706]|uniref:hypothetical protein n=1 Tax=Streptomyces sp. NBRC 109706 TaxID=1550035 RepID=UPI0007835219|nr:hypothetical protein [Streptomyces sp. NBRC 109706]